MNILEVRNYLRELCEAEGGAKPWGLKQKPKISHSYVSAVLRGERPPGKMILKALGLKKSVIFAPKPLKFEDVKTKGN